MGRIRDLRSYLEKLESESKLARVTAPVALNHELANAAVSFQRIGKACLFEKPDHGDWPVFSNGISSPQLAALALECEVEDIIPTMGAALSPANAVPPVEGSSAAWQENSIRGEDLDLWQLPIPIHGLHDGGPFITGGITIASDPVSGRGNLSYNRMQILGPHTLGFNVNEWRHVMQFYRYQEAQDEPLPIAVAIGVDPAISIAAGARYDDDELLIAGALRGEGVPVCRGPDSGLLIPATAEIVIEGYLPPHRRESEGPLAEFHGYYGELWQSPVVEVSAVHFRKNPIFQTIIPGEAEHIYIGNVLPREPLLLRFVRHVSSTVTGLHIPPYCNGFAAMVQVEKSNPGEPRNIALAAFTAHVNIKKVIVVDPDVNIYDPADVLWAMTNRVDWSRDVFTIPGAQGHEMDPTADERGIHTKIGIDATYKPDRRDYAERIRYPSVDLSEYS
ncbi:MAG: UbiD family decarboxylase [Anaerolineales bacterium]|nr:UbiD family decarboxylase [Anaerolineales bacterium]